MEHRIFRTKQDEYWDIWCEDAIVFPKERELKDVFTEENLRKLIGSYSDKDKYPTYEIEIVENRYVEVTIYAKGDLSNCKHCGRKYVICCICDEAEKRWTDMIAEVQAVSERDRSGEF